MPYPPGHRDAIKERIVASARRLFNRHGFEGVSVDRIMSGAGLTRGGFYSYFESKSELYTEVLGCFFTDPEWKSCWEGIEVDLKSNNVGPQVVRAYLSRQHFEDVENSCPMVALPGDVTRGGAEARRAFETVFEAMVSLLERSLHHGAGRARTQVTRVPMSKPGMPRSSKGAYRKNDGRHGIAQAMAALCIGGMVVARALDNRGLADDLRDSCMSVAFELAGWKAK
jgi:TetR/AcrR family transcriptional regulator, transcriptional repressor for nem operon